MKIIKSKKGDAFNVLNYGFWRILFISIVALTLFMFISSQMNDNVDIYDLKARVFAKRLVSSDNGISYISENSQRSYQGVISLDKFNQGVMSRQFVNSSDQFSASIVLDFIEGNFTEEAYANRVWFDRYYPLSKFDNYHGHLFWRYVLVENGSFEKGRILIKTVEKNE